MSLERLKKLPYYEFYTHPTKWTKSTTEIMCHDWRYPTLKRYIYNSQRVLNHEAITVAHFNGVPILCSDVYLRNTCTIGFIFSQPRRERIFGDRAYVPQAYLNSRLSNNGPSFFDVPLVELSNITKELYDSRIKELIAMIKNEERI